MMFLCYSRCLYCGRRTPHEVCHEHHRESPYREDFDVLMDELWAAHFNDEPEVCDDPACPQAEAA